MNLVSKFTLYSFDYNQYKEMYENSKEKFDVHLTFVQWKDFVSAKWTMKWNFLPGWTADLRGLVTVLSQTRAKLIHIVGIYPNRNINTWKWTKLLNKKWEDFL